MSLYDDVVMPLYVALLLWVGPGVILTPFLNNLLPSKKLKGIPKIILVCVVNVIAFGSIVLYGVLAIDYYQANITQLTTKKFAVVKYGYTSSRSGNKALFADINYQNLVKQIGFPDYALADSTKFRNVQLETAPGFLGFDVIKSKKLVK